MTDESFHSKPTSKPIIQLILYEYVCHIYLKNYVMRILSTLLLCLGEEQPETNGPITRPTEKWGVAKKCDSERWA